MARVLVVDDEDSIQETFSFFLRKASYDVTTVGSVAEAFKALDRERFELVITDILMPGDTGDTILERVVQEEEPPTVIMVTGQPDLEAMTDMMRRGAYDYLAKPVRKQTLLSTAARALEHRQLALSAKRLARENERYRQHLERLVEERTRALDRTNRRLMREIEERMTTEELMARQRDLAVALSRTTSQEEMLVAILETVQSLDDVDASGIHILQDTRSGAPFELLMTRGLPDNFPEHFHAISPAMPMYDILINGTPLHSDEMSEEMQRVIRSPNPEMLQRFSSISMIPVRYDGRTVATLNACSGPSLSAVSKRFLEAMAECLGGVINRVSLSKNLDVQVDRETIDSLGIAFPPFRSWGVWEWDPATDSLFWSYSLCRLLMLPNRSRITTLEPLLGFMQPQDAETFATLLRDTAEGVSEPLNECTLTLTDSTGRERPVLLICRGPLPERPHCVGIFISTDVSDADSHLAFPAAPCPEVAEHTNDGNQS